MYKELDDNELIYMINDNPDNYEILIEKYKPLVIKICNEYKLKAKEIGYELEDLIQVANMAVVDAINNYRDSKNVLFYTYLIHCIKNKMNTEFRNNQTNKKISLNEAISYDAIVPGTNSSYLELIPDKSVIDPFDCLLIEEKEVEYIHFLNDLPFEVAVAYELKKGGFTINEISNFLNLDKKSITKYLRVANQSALSKLS